MYEAREGGQLHLSCLQRTVLACLITSVMQNLVTLNFNQEAREADFRYNLVRVRENAESIAFYRGEDDERTLLIKVGPGGRQLGVGLGQERSRQGWERGSW